MALPEQFSNTLEVKGHRPTYKRTGFNYATFTYSGTAFDGSFASAGFNSMSSIYFSSDGLTAWCTPFDGTTIQEYSLTTAWDPSTLGSADNTVTLPNMVECRSFVWSKDGTKIWAVDTIGSSPFIIREYSVSTAWDITASLTDTGNTFSDANISSMRGLDVDETNQYLLCHGSSGSSHFFFKLKMATAGSIASVSIVDRSHDLEYVRYGRWGPGGRSIIATVATPNRYAYLYKLDEPYSLANLSGEMMFNPNTAPDPDFSYCGVSWYANGYWFMPDGVANGNGRNVARWELSEHTDYYYQTIIDSSGNIDMYGASSLTGTWAALDTTNGPTQTVATDDRVSTADDLSWVHVAHYDSSAKIVYYHRFNKSSNTWEQTGVTVANLTGMDSPATSFNLFMQANASDHIISIYCNGFTDTEMGTSYEKWDRYWSNNPPVGAASTTWSGPVGQGGSDLTSHQYGSNRKFIRVQDPDEASGNFEDIRTQTGPTTYNARNVVQVGHRSSDVIKYYYNTTLGAFVSLSFGEDTSDNLRLYEHRSTATTTIYDTQITDTTDKLYIPGTPTRDDLIPASIVVYQSESEMHAVFCGGGAAGANRDILYAISTDHGATWTDHTVLKTGTYSLVSASLIDDSLVYSYFDAASNHTFLDSLDISNGLNYSDIVPAATLTITEYAPELSGIEQGPGIVPVDTLTQSGEIPTVLISDHQEVPVPLGSIAAAGLVPIVSTPTDYEYPITLVVDIPIDTLAITEYAPTFLEDTFVYPPVGTVTVTGLVPEIQLEWIGTPPIDTLAITEYAPEADLSWLGTPPIDTLAITELVPTVLQDYLADVPTASLAITEIAPTVEIPWAGTVPQAELSIPASLITGQSSNFNGVADTTDVTTLPGWVIYGTPVHRDILSEQLRIEQNSANEGALYQASGLVNGTEYDLIFDYASYTGDNLTANVLVAGNSEFTPTEGTGLTFTFTATGTTQDIYFRAGNNSGNDGGYYDNIELIPKLAPVVGIQADIPANGTVTDLTFAGLAPEVFTPVTVDVPTLVETVDTYAPTVELSWLQDIPTGTITQTGYLPTIQLQWDGYPGVDTVIITEIAPKWVTTLLRDIVGVSETEIHDGETLIEVTTVGVLTDNASIWIDGVQQTITARTQNTITFTAVRSGSNLGATQIELRESS